MTSSSLVIMKIDDLSEPLLAKQKRLSRDKDDEEAEEIIVLLQEPWEEQTTKETHDSSFDECTVLLSVLYGLFFLQYFLLFEYKNDTGLEPMVVYATIVLFAAVSYLYNGVVATAYSTRCTDTTSTTTSIRANDSISSDMLQFIPEVIIISSMVFTFAFESPIFGFQWLVTGSCGLSTVVIVFNVLQLCCCSDNENDDNEALPIKDEKEDGFV
jgi:hypothetical protein